jgi:lipopolysaccharide export system permease protein
MRLCDRYLFKEFLQAFLVGLITAMLLVIALRFQQATTQLARDHATLGQLFQQIYWDLPNVLEMALPVATALGAALATNRLARDNELTVLRGTGTPLARIFLPFMALGLLLALAGLYSANQLQPLAAERRKQLASQATPQQGAFEQGQTVRGGKDGEWLIQFQEGARTTETTWKLFNVSLIQKERVLLAKEATYSANSGQWSLKNATEHRYDSAGRLLSELQRPTWPEPIVARTDFSSSLPFWELQQSFQTPLRFDQLGAKAQAAAKNGNKKQALEYETARWFKLALSSMCFVFALCAPPLSFKFSKAGSFSGVLLSVIIVFIGWNTVLFMKSVALSGWVPPVLCAFSTHVLFLLAGLWLLFRAD